MSTSNLDQAFAAFKTLTETLTRDQAIDGIGAIADVMVKHATITAVLNPERGDAATGTLAVLLLSLAGHAHASGTRDDSRQQEIRAAASSVMAAPGLDRLMSEEGL